VVVVEQVVDTRLGCARRGALMVGGLTAGALRWVVDEWRSFIGRVLVDDVELSRFVDNRLRWFAGLVVVELDERNDLLGQRQLEGGGVAGHPFRSTPEAANSPHGCTHLAWSVDGAIARPTERAHLAAGVQSRSQGLRGSGLPRGRAVLGVLSRSGVGRPAGGGLAADGGARKRARSGGPGPAPGGAQALGRDDCMSVRAPALRGDEAQLFAAHHAALRGRVARHVGTRASNIDDACSFAWLRLLRRQPERGKTLEWLTTVAIREARRLDRADRRLARLDAAGELCTQSNVLTHEQAREALEVVAGSCWRWPCTPATSCAPSVPTTTRPPNTGHAPC